MLYHDERCWVGVGKGVVVGSPHRHPFNEVREGHPFVTEVSWPVADRLQESALGTKTGVVCFADMHRVVEPRCTFPFRGGSRKQSSPSHGVLLRSTNSPAAPLTKSKTFETKRNRDIYSLRCLSGRCFGSLINCVISGQITYLTPT